jgi:hypothetical protein
MANAFPRDRLGWQGTGIPRMMSSPARPTERRAAEPQQPIRLPQRYGTPESTSSSMYVILLDATYAASASLHAGASHRSDMATAVLYT